MIDKTLRGEVVTTEANQEPRQDQETGERAFRVGDLDHFGQRGDRKSYTINSRWNTRDRPGTVLFDLTRTLANANVYIRPAL